MINYSYYTTHYEIVQNFVVKTGVNQIANESL